MKSRESKLILSIVILVILLIGMSINLILNPKGILTKKRQTVKEMTVSEYDNQITELNESHTDYARQVQENKKKLAQAISNENVPTSEDATVDEMVTNIGKILEARTSDATATADNITEGKTAWVNGELITGTGADNNSYLEQGRNEGTIKIPSMYNNAGAYGHTSTNSINVTNYTTLTIKSISLSAGPQDSVSRVRIYDQNSTELYNKSVTGSVTASYNDIVIDISNCSIIYFEIYCFGRAGSSSASINDSTISV